MTKLKLTLFYVFIVLAVLVAVGLSVWTSFIVSQKLARLDDVGLVTSSTVNDGDGAVLSNTNDIVVVPVADLKNPDEVKLMVDNFDFSSYKNTNAAANTSSPIQEVNLPTGIADVIQWLNPKKIAKLGFFGTDIDKMPAQGWGRVSTDYHWGGVFEYNNKPGAVVYADVTCFDEMGCGANPVSAFILYDNQVVFLAKNQVKGSDGFSDYRELAVTNFIDRSRVMVDNDFSLPYLDFPKEIKNSTENWKFEYRGLVPSGDDYYSASTSKKIYSDSVWGDFYFDYSDSEVFVIGRDKRVRLYNYVPAIVGRDGFISVEYDNGGDTVGPYNYRRVLGCGQPTVNVVKEGKEDLGAVLAVVGKTTDGVYVYGLTDTNNHLLKDFYNRTFYPGQTEGKLTYEEFVASRPVVFWRDQFGLLVMFQLQKFQPAAECGKPVIYLYPTKTEKVAVKLGLSKLTVSEPDYGNGWEVMAEPNGQLTEVKSGARYPYLFWEGLGAGEAAPIKAGFNVKKENVSKFLDEKLAEQGLNQKEINDFKEFWVPKMQSAPYYFVTFYGTSEMNKIAPLWVSPRPDTVIRVLMDYRSVGSPVNLPEQKLSTLPRQGFTVIEWGGVLYK